MPAILQNILIYPLSFVVVLSLVVFVHEFGHFQVARWRKVAIDTFSIGFGKTVFGWRDKHGVQWKIGALPLGGYVKFADDADPMSTAPVERIDDPEALAEARKKGLFHAQGLTTRSLVVAAGPITNFIFSIFAFAAIAFIVNDVTDITDVPARIETVSPGSAAAAAGLKAGDVIKSVDGVAIPNYPSLQSHIVSANGRSLHLQILRDGSVLEIVATPRRAPRADGNIRAGQPVLGILGPRVLPSEHHIIGYNPLTAIGYGANQAWTMVAQTASYVGGVFTGKESGNQIAGPVGIVNVAGQVASSALEVPNITLLQKLEILGLSLLKLAAILSVAVGIVNLLPIPILDGGHLMFYGIEALRGGKPLPPAAQEWAYRAGFAVMASLFLFATWNDITRLLPGAQ